MMAHAHTKACIGGALLPESTCRERNYYGDPSSFLVHPTAMAPSSVVGPVFSQYSLGVVHHPLALSGYLHAAKCSPLPSSDLQSPSLSTQTLTAPGDKHLRLESARCPDQPSLQVSLCFALYRLVFALYSEVPKLPLCPR